MTPCDLLIEPRWLIPVVPEGVVLEQHALAVADGRIVAIGPAAQLRARFAPAEHRQLPEHALMPGLVNAHTHAAMTLLRGIADDQPLMQWLSEHIWPVEAKWMGHEFVRDGAQIAIAEQLRGGVTTMQDMYFFSDAVAASAEAMGMRAVVGGIIIEFPSAWAATPDEYFDKAQSLVERYRSSSLIKVALAPHAPYTVSNRSFERVRALAEELDLRVHVHVHETAQEIADSLREHRMRPLQRLQMLGLVNERLSAVHMTQLSPGEIEICALAGISVLHCPESNLKLASGFCPVGALERAGINLALGTDGCASNNDLDLLGELKTAALLAKGVANDARALGAARALRMATLGGAHALGLGSEIGSLEVGKLADLTALRFDELDSLPVYHPISQIVYASHRRQVSDVWVGGRARVRDGVLCDIDSAELIAKARMWGERIASGRSA